MPDLEETIRRLSASFAEEIIAALRDVPLDDLIALSADGADGMARRETMLSPLATAAPVSPRARATRARRNAQRPAKAPADTAAKPESQPQEAALSVTTIDAAERVFAERGSRGATAAQLGDALAAQGVAVAHVAADVIRALVERDVIRDAGFRRTTGQGTAPVFVTCR